MQVAFCVDFRELEEEKTRAKPTNDGRNIEHDALQHDEHHYIDLAQAHHSHDTELKGFRLHREQEQRVDQQHRDHKEEQHDQIEYELEESDGEVGDLELLEDEGLDGHREIAQSLLNKVQVLHYVRHDFVELL